MSAIPVRLRRLVIQRANSRCEYCHLYQIGQEATFRIDHIKPIVAGGLTVESNLALACVSCSLKKRARERVVDPVTGNNIALYHPRTDDWEIHFQWEDVTLLGLTTTGRATVVALEMNRPLILLIRREEARLGRHP